MIEQSTPYLSVVVTTRNDDHGGDPLKRLQAFVNCFDEQCRRTGLDAEVIVVEWNPPPDRPTLDTLLRLPDSPACAYRFIEVPPEIHQTQRHADVLPLFQMIAKNVGVRRARGQFVLATNIDIIFSNELIGHIASQQLRKGRLYRVDRHDIESDFPVGAPLADQMEYCRSHQLREHTRWGSYPVDASGQRVALPEDVADGRLVRLGKGWHVTERGGDSLPYRWASDRAELLVDTSAGDSKGPSALDLEIESSPFDLGSWVEIVAMEGGRTLTRTRVAGRARLVIPVEPTLSGERRIELHAADASRESRWHLPAFERRSALYYRLVSARLRSLASGDSDVFGYPATRWNNAYEDSKVQLTATPDGLSASTDSRRWSYCIDYGPFRASRSGLHRFTVTCTVLEGQVAFGILSGDRTTWIRSTLNRREDTVPRQFEVAADLLEGQQFWLVVSNDHPDGEGVSTFVIHRLEGSEDPALILAQSSLVPRPSSLRRGAAKWADRLASVVSSLLGRRLRYRVARLAPEFEAVEQALRTSDRQLRALAPLGYLRGFDAFLRERRPTNLHQNGCGDFQLMAREHWFELRGYPEFQMFSMNIDGFFNSMAHSAGVKEEAFESPLCIYHLEHEKGSGWTPEGEAALRKRIAESGITWLENETVHILGTYMEWFGRPMILNGSDWGFGEKALAEKTHAPAAPQQQKVPS